MVASEQHLFQTIVQFVKTIILTRKLATGIIHDYLLHYHLGHFPTPLKLAKVISIFKKNYNTILDIKLQTHKPTH